jgi:hypothetical protein
LLKLQTRFLVVSTDFAQSRNEQKHPYTLPLQQILASFSSISQVLTIIGNVVHDLPMSFHYPCQSKARHVNSSSARLYAHNLCYRMSIRLENARHGRSIERIEAEAVKTLSIKQSAGYRTMIVTSLDAPIIYEQSASWHRPRNGS